MDNSNILPSATNATQSIESGSLGDVIEFMTWNDLVLQQGIRSADTDYASRIRNNIVDADDTIHSSSLPSYMSLYIPLTQSFNISDIQSFVLYIGLRLLRLENESTASKSNCTTVPTDSLPEPTFFIVCLLIRPQMSTASTCQP